MKRLILLLVLGVSMGAQDAGLELALRPTGVTAGTYGGVGNTVQITVDSKGRVTFIQTVAQPGGGFSLPFSLSVSGKILTLGADCVSAPCKFAFRNQVFSVTTASTATLSAGSGTAYITANKDGKVLVSTKLLTVACSGCDRDMTADQQLPDTILLYSCGALNGNWTLPCLDWRTPYSREPNNAGPGIAIQKVGVADTIMVDHIGLRQGVSFTTVDTVSIPFAVHGIGSPDLVPFCRTSGNPFQVILPDSVAIDPATNDVTIRFLGAKSGRCSVL